MFTARNVSGFAFHVPKQMAGAIWQGAPRAKSDELLVRRQYQKPMNRRTVGGGKLAIIR
jgi:hypothetical protein